MKEELIKVLKNKLDDINSDIDSLTELNENISNEQEELSYVSSILDLFRENNNDNVMNFVKLSKDDFHKIIDLLGSDVKDVFSSPSCNYDGLVYLISGINDGVSLTLTEEQKNGITLLIERLSEKKDDYLATIDGYNIVKSRYSISDIDELKAKKDNYHRVLDELDHKEYVSDIDLLLESFKFSSVSPEKTIDILKYLLEYNADVYINSPKVENRVDDRKEEDNLPSFDLFDNNTPSFENDTKEEFEQESQYIEETEANNDFQEFHFNDVVKDDFTNFSPLSFNNDSKEENKEEDSFAINDDYVPVVEDNEISDKESVNDDEQFEEISTDQFDNVESSDEIEESEVSELSDNLTTNDNVKVSTSDLHVLLEKYDIKEDNTYINELVVGDIKNYSEVLDILKDNNLIDNFKNNSELLVETLLYSNSDAIKDVLKIIKNDLSVDNEDYVITTKIVVDTIPSIFIVQDGNYDNFIENVKTFKDLDLNLINLFDFSKEIFVANHEVIVNNLEIVKKYDITITHENAKYLLLLSNIGDRLDYYVESVYEDKEKNEIFDGIEYINLYTAKLNVVTDETIKRLRFCSENGQKIFGNKPKSLTGDITNLKVNSLDITADYLSKFFNNEFSLLTGDEVREYIKLIHNSSNVGNYDDELEILDKYRKGLRYVIEGINISYNKVLRNYSILRSYGIDTKKALHFAVCYNLVITKDEYDKLNSVLDEIGGMR